MISNVGHDFTYSLTIWISSSEKCLINSLPFSLLSCKNSLYILNTRLFRYMIYMCFLLLCVLSFESLDAALWSTKVLNFDQVQTFLLLFSCIFGANLRNHFLTQDMKMFFFKFSSFSSYIKIYDLFWVIFVYDMLLGSSFILLHVNIHLSYHHLLKRVLFPHWIIVATWANNNWS